jgi:glucose dehydrogenase
MRIHADTGVATWLPIALLAAQSAFAQGADFDAKRYPKVTDERLEHPDAGDWLMYRRTYDGSGYSPLNQITPSNIRQLTLAWSVSTDLLGAHETTAIVNHGRMFITTPQNNIHADAPRRANATDDRRHAVIPRRGRQVLERNEWRQLIWQADQFAIRRQTIC